MKALYFDIETAPLPDELITWPKFYPAKHLVDAEKKKESVEQKRRAFIDGACLLPQASYVCAVGAKYDDSPQVHIRHQSDWRNEKILIEWILGIIETACHMGRAIVGFNIVGFDLKYLYQKALKHNVQKPAIMMMQGKYGMSDKRIVDLRDILSCGEGKYAKGKLEEYCEYFGFPVKTFSGKYFHEVLVEDHIKAMDYLKWDVATLQMIWNRHDTWLTPPTKGSPAPFLLKV